MQKWHVVITMSNKLKSTWKYHQVPNRWCWCHFWPWIFILVTASSIINWFKDMITKEKYKSVISMSNKVHLLSKLVTRCAQGWTSQIYGLSFIVSQFHQLFRTKWQHDAVETIETLCRVKIMSNNLQLFYKSTWMLY